MIANFDFDFSQHQDRIRRAEKQYTLSVATNAAGETRPQAEPRRRLWTLLRRIAGTPAAA
jgi:hypothetical protein